MSVQADCVLGQRPGCDRVALAPCPDGSPGLLSLSFKRGSLLCILWCGTFLGHFRGFTLLGGARQRDSLDNPNGWVIMVT